MSSAGFDGNHGVSRDPVRESERCVCHMLTVRQIIALLDHLSNWCRASYAAIKSKSPLQCDGMKTGGQVAVDDSITAAKSVQAELTGRSQSR